ncbi:MAG: hypothetical protein WA152_02770 [Microgenomates group bacterium]
MNILNKTRLNNNLVTKSVSVLSIYATYNTLFPSLAHAVCPICTVAVAGGLGLSRYFGIDDSVIGIWSGGLMVSLTLWTVDWLSKKSWKFLEKVNEKTRIAISFLFWVLLTYPPLFAAGIIGHPFNTILGIDKLVFGSILGFFAFLLGVWTDKKVREIKGKQLFNFQKVVFPVLSLTIFSLVLYFWGGYLYKL